MFIQGYNFLAAGSLSNRLTFRGVLKFQPTLIFCPISPSMGVNLAPCAFSPLCFFIFARQLAYIGGSWGGEWCAAPSKYGNFVILMLESDWYWQKLVKTI